MSKITVDGTRQCCKCREFKPADLANFMREPRNTNSGLSSRCRPCQSAYAKEIRAANRPPPASLPQRFWGKVNKLGPTECWEWQASRQRFGYGQIMINQRPVRAHRVAWELMRGPIPDGLSVLHKCDNPPCCNPDHLFLGTQQINMEDKVRKGRQPVGEDAGGSKLTSETVRAMRTLHAAGWTMERIARLFFLSTASAADAVSGRTWSSVA